ncbi:hypothetical protein CJP16_06545 [Aeromonas sobria]|uniref:Glycosyl transferase family 1 n=2 Tax=Aeromonas sobria TaxID=646 RepID=A0A2N3J3R2_AERSO|nr:hypothetical protein CJP16_06545 [Aeromonas sobria]
MKDLKHMSAIKRLNILMLYEADISSVQLVETVLSRDIFVLHKAVINSELIKNYSYYHMPLFIRSVDPEAVKLARKFVSESKPFVYYIDDNFWEIKGDTPLAKYYQHPIIRDGLKYIVGHASMVLCNSIQLADYIRERYTKRVSVVPPMFDFNLVEGVSSYDGEEIRIGFAGSSSRLKDINFLKNVIPEILEKYPSVVFEFAGVMPEGVQTSDRVRYFKPVSSYAEYISFQYSRGWKIGLAPLLGSESDCYKTNNKFREYSACYTAGIYSDSLSYKGSLIDNVNGLVCYSLTPQEWLLAISSLLDDTALRDRLAHTAHEFVKTHYDVNIISTAWHEALLTASNVPPKPESKIIPLVSFYKRFKWQLFLYKLRAEDVYKNRGGAGLLKHILIFLYRKIVGVHGKI